MGCVAYLVSDSSLENCAGVCKWRVADDGGGGKFVEQGDVRLVAEKGGGDTSLRFSVVAHRARVSGILWLEKGGIVTVGWDKMIKTWSPVNGSLQCSAPAQHGAVNDAAAAAAAAADARDPQIATVGADGMLRVWASSTLTCTASASVASRDASHVKYSAVHDAWFTSAHDMCVRMFSRQLQCMHYVKMSGLSITALAVDDRKGFALGEWAVLRG